MFEKIEYYVRIISWVMSQELVNLYVKVQQIILKYKK